MNKLDEKPEPAGYRMTMNEPGPDDALLNDNPEFPKCTFLCIKMICCCIPSFSHNFDMFIYSHISNNIDEKQIIYIGALLKRYSGKINL